MITNMRYGRGQDLAPLHYPECGLPDVYLLSGYRLEVDDEGDSVLMVEDIDGLLTAIGADLVFNKKVLTGCDVRFLRKQLYLSQEELGLWLGTSDQTVARWEKGEAKMNGAADALLRLLFMERAGLLSKLQESSGLRLSEFLKSIRSRSDASVSQKKLFEPDSQGKWHLKAA